MDTGTKQAEKGGGGRLETLCKAKTCLEARTLPKLLQGHTSLGSKAIYPRWRQWNVCLYGPWRSVGRQMYKTPLRRSLRPKSTIPVMAKKKKKKTINRKCSQCEWAGNAPQSPGRGTPSPLRRVVPEIQVSKCSPR